ncbi:MAG TPA: hypothetical protein VJP87_06760, partial [Candidatus Acidoferrales bacterium]|nr:hypothetical protein [Candidatus Acidoferrales bacterium]
NEALEAVIFPGFAEGSLVFSVAHMDGFSFTPESQRRSSEVQALVCRTFEHLEGEDESWPSP